jgi:MerR HTH family regulatory protein
MSRLCIARSCDRRRVGDYFCAEHHAEFYGTGDEQPADPRPEPGRTHLTGPKAAEAAGVTYRRLHIWDQGGLIRPDVPSRGSGTSRYYSPARVDELRVAGELVRMGMTSKSLYAFGPAGRRTLLGQMASAFQKAHEADARAMAEDSV